MKDIPKYIHEVWVKDRDKDKDVKPDYAMLAQLCRDSLAAHPEDSDSLMTWEVDFTRSARQYEKALEVASKNLPLMNDPDYINDVNREMVWCLDHLGRHQEAADLLKERLRTVGEKKFFDYDELYKQLEKLGDKEGVLKYKQQYADEQADQLDTDELQDLGKLYDEKKDYEKSFKYIVLAAQRESYGSGRTWAMAGRALALSGKKDEAMFYFQMANKIKPEDGLIHYYIGQSYQDKGDMYRAMHHYMEALKDEPDLPEVYNNLAALSFNEEGNIKTAIEYLEEALKHDKDGRMKVLVYKSLAQLHHKLANYDQHEYYKGKLLEALGFPVEGEEGDEYDDDGVEK